METIVKIIADGQHQNRIAEIQEKLLCIIESQW